MKIISGGQTGVDRAALDVAIARCMAWGGWCPKGGWAEDFPEPPGLLPSYPRLQETPLSDPLQRTQWNVRDSDASLIIVDRRGLAASNGTRGAHEWAREHGKPELIVDVDAATAPVAAAEWLRDLSESLRRELTVSIGGPRESEAPGIYTKARRLLEATLNVLE